MTTKALCIALHAAIDDELNAVNEYDRLSRALELSMNQLALLSKIKRDEEKHYRELSDLYLQLDCITDETDMILEKEQYLLPKEERIRRAKQFVSQF